MWRVQRMRAMAVPYKERRTERLGITVAMIAGNNRLADSRRLLLGHWVRACGLWHTAGVVSNVVQHVVVPVVESRLCNRLYQAIADKVKLDISDDMMCAGIEEGGRDACQVPARRSLSILYRPVIY